MTKEKRNRAPSKTPEGRENQLISWAIDLAEKQLRDGSASAQVIAHFLKLGSGRERIEKDILVEKKKLIEAQTKAIQSSEETEKLYRNALKAMKTYSGKDDSEEAE